MTNKELEQKLKAFELQVQTDLESIKNHLGIKPKKSDDIILPEWPKILEFRDKKDGTIIKLFGYGYGYRDTVSGLPISCMLNEGRCVKSGDYEIRKIQLKNGDVFSVFDEHWFKGSRVTGKITEFYVTNNEIRTKTDTGSDFYASDLFKPQQKKVARLEVDDDKDLSLIYKNYPIFYISKITGKFNISPYYAYYEQWRADGFPCSTNSIKWTRSGGKKMQYRIDKDKQLWSNNEIVMDLETLDMYDNITDPNIKLNPISKRIYIY